MSALRLTARTPELSAGKLRLGGQIQQYRATGGYGAALWFDARRRHYIAVATFEGDVTEWNVWRAYKNAQRAYKLHCQHAYDGTVSRVQLGVGWYPTVGAIGVSVAADASVGML